jgi:tetratricopeptide (TPR) repeat protein
VLTAYCSNLPLALRIAAERIGARPSLGLADMVEELADERARLDVLDSGDAYSTVRTVFSWSYQGLDERSAAAFRALGVHPGHTFDVPAVAALTGTSRSDANAEVKALTDAHLVTELAPGRYSMHDLLRVYTRELADERADERHGNLQRLFDHYLHTSDRADRLLTPHRFRISLDGDATMGLAVDDVTAARRWLENERENLVAMCRIDEPAFDSRRWQLAFVLRGYFYLTKRLDGWVDTHTQALAACLRAGDGWAEAVTRNNLGMALVASGRLDEAMSHYRHAERLFDAVGDLHGVSNALANQASVLRRWGSYEDALCNQGRALAHYRRSGAQRNAGITLRSMARVNIDAGQLGDAVRCAQEAVDLALGLGHDLDIAQAFNVLGMAQHRVGDAALAEIATHQAIEFSHRCGSQHEEARAAHRLGTLLAESGRVDEASRWWRTALDLYRELGSAQAELVAADLAGLGDR